MYLALPVNLYLAMTVAVTLALALLDLLRLFACPIIPTLQHLVNQQNLILNLILAISVRAHLHRYHLTIVVVVAVCLRLHPRLVLVVSPPI